MSGGFRHRVGPLGRTDPGGWYNGFSWEQRIAANPVQAAAIREGRMLRPTVCGIAGQVPAGDPRGCGYVFMHNEDYDRPLRFHAVGRAVHQALHARFTDPLPWLALVRRQYVHGAWFTFLTMDPADMRRPFQAIYPNGLPPDGTLWPALADALGLHPGRFAESLLTPKRSASTLWGTLPAGDHKGAPAWAALSALRAGSSPAPPRRGRRP